MPEHCSCGTTLVENARFCHRCGKPTFEMEDVAEADAPPLPMAQAIPDATSAATPRPISFRNPIAMRVAFLMCVGIMLVQVIPGAQLLFVLWFVAFVNLNIFNIINHITACGNQNGGQNE